MVVRKALQNHSFHFKGIKVSASRKKSCKSPNKRVPASSIDEALERVSGEGNDDSRKEQQVFTLLDPVSRLLWSQALRSMH